MSGSAVTLLRRLVDQRRLTREETRRLLIRRAGTLGIDGFTLELRQLDRWLRGHVKSLPHAAACRVLEAEFGHPVEQLLHADPLAAPDSASPEVAQLITTAAQRSASWGRWADSLGVGELALEGLRLRLAKLASDYVHTPMVPVVRDLVALRDDLFEVLSQPDPGQARELYFLAGAACGMIAHASGNLGYSTAALDQAQTAMICARKADHPMLAAWITGVRALQCEWGGRPAETLHLLAQARHHTAKVEILGTTPVWLTAIQARAQARLGDRDAAETSVDELDRLRDRVGEPASGPLSSGPLSSRPPSSGRVSGGPASSGQVSSPVFTGGPDDLDRIGGIFSFDLAKEHFYLATTHRRLDRFDRAAVHADAAIDAYQAGPVSHRSYGDEALAGIELALARTLSRRADLDGAAAAVERLRGQRAARLAAMTGPLHELLSAVSRPDLRSSPLVSRMQDEVSQLLRQCQRQKSS